jgi:hypothetical protein
VQCNKKHEKDEEHMVDGTKSNHDCTMNSAKLSTTNLQHIKRVLTDSSKKIKTLFKEAFQKG